MVKNFLFIINLHSNPHMYNTEISSVVTRGLGVTAANAIQVREVLIAQDAGGRRRVGDFCTFLSILLLSYLKPQTNNSNNKSESDACL